MFKILFQEMEILSTNSQICNIHRSLLLSFKLRLWFVQE